MKLTREQNQKLLRERGIWVTNACDKCGQLLGAVRWTRKDEEGEWCSAECRDGLKPTPRNSAGGPEATASTRRIGARAAGRPRTHSSNAEKQRAYRYRLTSVLALRNSPSQVIQISELAVAKNGSHVVGLIPEPGALETAPTQECA